MSTYVVTLNGTLLSEVGEDTKRNDSLGDDSGRSGSSSNASGLPLPPPLPPRPSDVRKLLPKAEALAVVPPRAEALVVVAQAEQPFTPASVCSSSSASTTSTTGISSRGAGQAPRVASISSKDLLRRSIAFSASSRLVPILSNSLLPSK